MIDNRVNSSTSISNVIIMLFLLAISGNPIFTNISKWVFLFASPAFLGLCLIRKKNIFKDKLLFLMILSLLLFCFQGFRLEQISIAADVNFLLKIACASFSVCFFGKSFCVTYEKTIYLVCLFSLVFSIPILFGKDFGFVIDRYHSIGIFNYLSSTWTDEEGYRNCGMFWEPGAFQGYILLVPILYLDNLKNFIKGHKIEVCVLLISLLSTKSTTGYICLFLLVFLILTKKIKNTLLKFSTIIVSVCIGFFAFNKLEFLGNKIKEELSIVSSISSNDVSWNRLTVAKIDFYNTMRHPISGNGFLLSERYGEIGDLMTGVGNGLTGTFNMFGILYTSVLLFFIFISSPISSKYYRAVYFFILILLLNGEYFLNYPTFMCLLFLGNNITKKRPMKVTRSYNSNRKNEDIYHCGTDDSTQS